MSAASRTRSVPNLTRRRALVLPGAAWLAGAVGPTLLAACGGGPGSENPAPPAGGATPQSLTIGPITGLGSIIVNGVRFDDNAARIEDDEDGSSSNRGALRLGMMVEVQSSRIDDASGRAIAAVIRFGAEMKGRVQSIDATAQTFTMIDQTIEVRPETVFDDSASGGFDGIDVGQILEVHALFDAATGRYIATRIEREDDATLFKLRGLISALDSAAKTFRIGAAVINYAGIAPDQLPPNLADGMRIRVRLQPEKVNNQWIAVTLRSGVRRVDDIGDARLIGLVTAFTSPQQFSVQGIPVNATNARFEPNADAVKLGAHVMVRGTASNGTIFAARVKVIDARVDEEWRVVELHGTIAGLDKTAKTFMVRNVKVDYSKTVEFKDGTVDDLADGKAVEVKGVWSSDRSVLVAARIEFE